MDEDVIVTSAQEEMPALSTTKRQSAFQYDNGYIHDSDGDVTHFQYDNNLAARVDGVYYDLSSIHSFEYADGFFYVPRNTTVFGYDAASGFWEVTEKFPEGSKISVSDILAQNQDSSLANFYSTQAFVDRHIPMPMGTVFDSIYTVDALGGVLAVLPVLMAVLVGFVAVRKGIAFIHSRLNRG